MIQIKLLGIGRLCMWLADSSWDAPKYIAKDVTFPSWWDLLSRMAHDKLRYTSVVRHLSCYIKKRLFRRHFVKNPRNTSVLLRFLPRIDEKSIFFISSNLRDALH